MHRFFVEEAGAVGAEIALPPDEARHAGQVLRLAAGETVELLGAGRIWAATLARCDKSGVIARVTAELPSREPRLRVTLCQGLAKADKMEWIIQKATELGVHAIQPLAMRRCVMQVGRADARVAERWPRIAKEAAKQCGRAEAPQVLPPAPVARLGALWAAQQKIIVPWEEVPAGQGSLAEALADGITTVALVIGPEGGIDPAEIAELRGLGAAPVTLGPRILRTETAAVAALAAIMALAGEWS